MIRLASLILTLTLVAPVSGCVSCPTALLEGVLVNDGSGGLAVQIDDGATIPVRWPDWHGVSVDDATGRLVVTGPFGAVAAREGDRVALGGGEDPNGPGFKVCGQIGVKAASS